METGLKPPSRIHPVLNQQTKIVSPFYAATSRTLSQHFFEMRVDYASD